MYEGKNGAGNVKTVFLFSLAFAFMLLSVSQVAAQNCLYSENFNSGAAQGWQALEGTWSVQSNEYMGTFTSNGPYGWDRSMSNVGASWTDYVYTAKVRLVNDLGFQHSAIFFRVKDSNNHYEFFIRKEGSTTDAFFSKVVNGARSDIIRSSPLSYNWDVGQTYTLKVVVQGSTMTGYIDGTQVLTTSESSVPNGGIGVGVYESGAAFDDLRVETIGNEGACAAAPACPSGMVSYWKFDETSGTTASDSKDSNPGTLINGASFVPGKIGNGANIPLATSGAINIPMSSNLNLPGTNSYELWINMTQYYSSGVGRMLVYMGSNYYDVSIGSYGGEGGIPTGNIGLCMSGYCWVNTGIHLNLNTLYHIVVTHESDNKIKIYVNGVLSFTSSQPVTYDVSSATRLVLGAAPENAGQGIGAVVDEFAVYNRALTQDEITAHYNGGTGKDYCQAAAPTISTCGQDDTQGMVSYWKGDGNAKDSFGSSDGTWSTGEAYTAGKVGQAFLFAGTNKKIVVNNLIAGTDYTLEAWVKTNTPITGSTHHILWAWPDDASKRFLFGLDSYSNSLGLYPGAWTDMRSTPSLLVVDNQWHHVAVTKSAAAIKLYVDGNEYSTSGNSVTIDSNAEIGYYWDGPIDELAVYNRVLSKSEIQAHMVKGNSGQPYCERAAAPPEPICTAGQAQPCYTGPTGTQGVGICAAGTKTCSQDGMSWGACTGDVVPQVEICNSLDDNCDGTVDNVADADKPVCSKHLGVCAGAKQVCSGGNWIDCTEADYQSYSQYYAIVENTNVTCWDGADNDCNGPKDANEPFCQPGSGVQPLEPCTLNQMFDANSDGVIDSYDVILLLRQVVLLPNRYVDLKPCQAITVQPQ